MTRVGVVQFQASQDKDENLQKILTYISEAADGNADLCAFPEFMMLYTPDSQSASDLSAAAESVSGAFVTAIRDAARRNSIEVVGTMYEKSPRPDRVYDTAFLVSSAGNMVSVYRKIHLYDALGIRESSKMEPGPAITPPVRTAMGKTGMIMCYDLRFPEMARALAEAGSEILVAPSAWVAGEKKVEHWITMNRARAIENGCYVVAPDHTGNIYCGRSLVVDPFGDILLDMDIFEGIAYADIDRDRIRTTREKLPLLQNRRLDIYPRIWSG